jgi:adenosyl cobinamide kinase/adenosyl cobinamide phosphate guanylyltransferase
MKKTDMERLKGARIAGQLKQAGTPARYGKDSAAESRRERRRREQALGLVPIALKLDAGLVERLREHAQRRGAALDAAVAELLQQALDSLA